MKKTFTGNPPFTPGRPQHQALSCDLVRKHLDHVYLGAANPGLDAVELGQYADHMRSCEDCKQYRTTVDTGE